MSSLLQSDITDDAAANAYLDYLTNLEEVAKLEPCGLYYQPGTENTNEASYVVARTAGAHRKYYFRERQSESWTPWTQVKIDCEDMPLTPIVWDPTGTGSKGRLFLFWLKILKQTSVDPNSMPAPLSPPNVDMRNNTLASVSLDDLNSGLQSNAAAQTQIAVNAVLCWSEYYNGKWQTTKTSDLNRPTSLGTFPATGPKSFDINRDLWRIVPAQFTGQNPLVTIFNAQNWLALPSTSLILVIIPPNEPGAGAGYTPGQWAPYDTCGFVLHNMHSRPVRLEDVSGISSNSPVGSVPLAALLDPLSPFRGLGPVNSYDGGNANGGTFGINYQSSYYYSDGFTNNILGFNWTPRYVEPQFGLSDAWDAPFIFEDRRYLFYVTTVEQQVPIIVYQGFGISPSSLGNPLTLEIPPLVLRQPLIQPVGPEGILATNIHVALGSSIAISYQGQDISQTGSVIGLNSAAGSGERNA
jgi:Neuraminidase-like domain